MDTFKQKLHTGEKLIGTFIQTAHPSVAEVVGKLGFDFILIDSEHSAMTNETVQTMLQAVSSTPAYGLVRIPAIRSEYIAGYLDAGADALVIPQVRSVEDVQLIKDAALYPPEGKRGIGPGRGTGYGMNLAEKKNSPNKNTAIIIQIETKEALDNLEEILSIDFYDMVFIGPGDLSMNLGVFGEFDHPMLLEAITKIITTSKQYGKKVGIFTGSVAAANRWLAEGVDLVVLSSELALMSEYVKQCLNQLDYKDKEIAQ